MKASALLLASVLGAGQSTGEIDRGADDGLSVGDRGRVFYELVVNGEGVEIDVGAARVVEVESASARIRPAAGALLRRGYRVAFEIPSERMRLRETGILAASEVAKLDETAAVRERFARPLSIEGGLYTIGRDAQEAKFFNETPAFAVQLPPFAIDRRPVSRFEYAGGSGGLSTGDSSSYATGVTFEEASAFCRGRGLRLPTEFEWEVGVGEAGPPEAGPVYEWTQSWYLPYPGNERPEESYGRRYRVVRGGVESATWSAHWRGYLDPSQGEATVGFRCAGPSER